MDAIDVSRLWPLSQHFEYAAELGLEWRMHSVKDWEAFEAEVDLRQLPLRQAQGFAFLQWLEVNDADRLADLLPVIIGSGSRQLLIEFQASLECMVRDYSVPEEPDPLPALNGEPLTLLAPRDCLFPSREFDDWTKSALSGSTINVLESQPAEIPDLRYGHGLSYLTGIRDLAAQGGALITPETRVETTSWDSCRAAAGALIAAADYAARRRRSELILCRVRPGSHHAEPNRGGGTCLINNLAIAARRAVHHASALNVAIVDIDAHHGNGTERVLYEEKHVRVASVHQTNPFFPGTGNREDRGHGRGKGSNLNLPVSPDDDWLEAVRGAISWALKPKPAMLFLELSTDAHRNDPVSDLRATDKDFRTIGQELGAAGLPVICELGSSLSQRAWIGGVRSLISGFAEASSSSRTSY